MPRLTRNISVNITDNLIQDGQRSWTIEIRGAEALFLLADMLVKEGAIKDLDWKLRGLIRDAVEEHIASSRAFIRGVAQQAKSKSA